MHLVNKVFKTDRAFLSVMHPLIPQCVYFASIPRNPFRAVIYSIR